MADINNAQLNEFCNSQLRTQADRLARVDMLVPGILAEYAERNLGTIINDAGSSNNIADGASESGRTIVAGGDIYNFITLLNDLDTWLDASGRRSIIAKWQVNGYRI